MKIKLSSAFFFAIFFAFAAKAQVVKDTTERGIRAPAANFTGNVWVKRFVADTVSGYAVSKVTFEKGARSNWHYHYAKQVVVHQGGIGYLKQKDKPLQILGKGDVAVIEPGVLHWHGAAPDSGFEQLVMSQSTSKGLVTWLNKVTDEEYNAANNITTTQMMIRLSEIEIDSAYLEEYMAILKTEAAASVKIEPGVIAIYPMYQKEYPNQIRILEIYADRKAYESHLQTPHFKEYKTTTLKMVKALKLVDMHAIDLTTMPLLFKKLN